MHEREMCFAYCGAADRVQQLSSTMPKELQLRQTFKGGAHWMKVLTLTEGDADLGDLVPAQRHVSREPAEVRPLQAPPFYFFVLLLFLLFDRPPPLSFWA